MAVFTKIYCIGGGSYWHEGLNPILAQIWLGESSRMWYEGHYFHDDFGPLGRLKVIVPPEPDREDNLLDACIAFFPKAFEECPSYAEVLEQLGDAERLDFHMDPEGVPEAWANLREEAREEYLQLGLWEAGLEPVERG